MRTKRQTFFILTVPATLLVGSILLASALGAVFIPPADTTRMSLDKLPFINLESAWQPAHDQGTPHYHST